MPTVVAQPAIDDAEAKAAMSVAKAFVAAPAKVTRGAKSWSFGPTELASWTSFRPVGKTGEERLQAYIDPVALADFDQRDSFGKLGTAPRNASFKVDNGRVTIVPSKDGVGPDISALASDLTSALAQADGPRTVELKIGRAAPTTHHRRGQDLRHQGAARDVHDDLRPLQQAARQQHPSARVGAQRQADPARRQFSFNGAVGQRTAEKGYQEANAIVAGKLVPQLGGGICQVGTTLFNTVFFSGLPVDQRMNHSFYISHYPAGRDATVSWGGPDFKFKNTTGTGCSSRPRTRTRRSRSRSTAPTRATKSPTRTGRGPTSARSRSSS